MKQLPAFYAVLLFLATPTTRCLAQTLTVAAPDYGAAKLFESSPGFTITGMGASPGGDLFYLEGDAAFPPTAATTLYKRSAANGYAIAAPLFQFGTPAFGAFVVFHEGTVYFGESSAGTIHAVAADGTGHAVLGTVPGVYDLSFAGNSAFVSANSETDFGKPPRNKISAFDLGSGALDSVLDTGGDYSGALEFDAAGNLLYGATAVGAIRDVHAFSAAEIASAIGPGELTLSPPSHRIIENGKNVYLAFAGPGTLWSDDFTSLRMSDLPAGTGRMIATTGDTLGHLDVADGDLFVNVTSFSAGKSAIFAVEPIPEPRGVALLAVGLVGLSQRRSFRSVRG